MKKDNVYLFALPHFDLSRNEGVAAYDALMKKYNLVYGQAWFYMVNMDCSYWFERLLVFDLWSMGYQHGDVVEVLI